MCNKYRISLLHVEIKRQFWKALISVIAHEYFLSIVTIPKMVCK